MTAYGNVYEENRPNRDIKWLKQMTGHMKGIGRLDQQFAVLKIYFLEQI